MTKADIYNTQGKKTGSVDLPERVFNVAWNDSLVHQVVVSMQSNARTPVAHTKDRSDVAGGGRKPWRQKGTGRARHGSIRSPLWRGGGVTFGPRNDKDFSKDINKKMRAKALFTALSKKFKDGEVLFVDTFAFDAPKTADAKKTLGALASIKGFEALANKRKNNALIALALQDEKATRSFANFGNVAVKSAQDLNPVDVLQYKHIIIVHPNEAIGLFEKRAESISTKESKAKKAPAKKKAQVTADKA